jgi:DNA repair protein RecN (Recombination protein N)
VEGKQAVQQFLNDNELDNEDELVLRREISSNGKSRGFINDTPAMLQQLKELASLLVDLHQQFDTLELGDSGFQRDVLDALAANFPLLATYQNHFQSWQQHKNELEKLVKQKDTFQKEFDYHQFMFNELEHLNLKPNELEDLENELKLLSNSESIKTALSKIYFDLKESEQPVIYQIKMLTQQLQSFVQYHPDLPAILERLNSTQLELQDIADEVEQINDQVNFDQERIEQINERLSYSYKLLKKHNVKTTDQLIAIRNEQAAER